MNNSTGSCSGNIIDVIQKKIYPGILYYDNGKITRIEKSDPKDVANQFISPGFVDAHLHIESSLLTPYEFARASMPHGTIACVCDPHEIANVAGIRGIDFMIENGKLSPMKYCFGVPSCVPATDFETSGARIDASTTKELLERPDLHFLGEMMNYVGVLQQIPEVMDKLDAAKETGKPVDGHAPRLHGKQLLQYVAAGISTDHECANKAEGLEKIKDGMLVQIRDGSAATDFTALIGLANEYPDRVMFCTDDKHPDDLLEGHMDRILEKAVASGVDPIQAIRSCSLIPCNHYGIEMGLLRPGDPADFIVLEDLEKFRVKSVYVEGTCVAKEGKSLFEYRKPTEYVNNFEAIPLILADLSIDALSGKIRCMEIKEGELFTKESIEEAPVKNGEVVSDPEKDLLKLVVYNRYTPGAKPQFGFVRNFGLKKGAFASSIGHDSHNLIAIGSSDEEILHAMNTVIERKGALVACCEGEIQTIPLPIGGLMSSEPFEKIAAAYHDMTEFVGKMGTSLHAPFLTLAFLSLPVIPELRLTDKGLFSVVHNRYVPLFVEDPEKRK